MGDVPVAPVAPTDTAGDAVADTLADPLALPLAYPVHVGRGLEAHLGAIVAAAAPAHRYAIVTDHTVGPLHASAALSALSRVAPADRIGVFAIPAGESEKTRARWAELTDALFDWGAGRDTTVVALGGGVVGDLAGFVAATFMRGVPVVQVPTTLLAMVDAAVGGKTGVDTPQGKNLVGAFHDPQAVVMAVETLATLPAPTFRSGWAEIIKHGVIADAAYFARVLAALPDIGVSGAELPGLAELIAGSVRIKARVVAEDAREGGVRHTLNFGHTIAHAVEQLLDYRMLHGEAVAIGMVAEARIAEAMGIAAPGLADTIMAAVRLAGLPSAVPPGLEAEAILAATRADKKARGGEVRYALPRRVGAMERGSGAWSVPVPDSAVLASIAPAHG